MKRLRADFGARGDGITDDTLAVSKWLDSGGAIEAESGTYAVSSTLRIASGTTILAYGAVFKTAKGWPADRQLLLNRNLDTIAQHDADIRIIGGTFVGDPLREMITSFGAHVELMAMVGVRNLTLRDVTFRSWRGHMLSFNNCSRVAFDGVEIDDYGSKGVVPHPGTCEYEGGCGILAYTGISEFMLRNVYIHDGMWTAVLMTGPYWLVNGLRIFRVMEGGLFGGPTKSIISNFQIDGVKVRDCEGNGLELGGDNNNINSGSIRNTEHNSMLLSNPLNVRVGNVMMHNPGAGNACIAARNHPALIQKVNNFSLTENTASCDTGLARDAIALWNMGNGPFDNCTVARNNCGSASQWSDVPCFVGPGVPGVNFITDEPAPFHPPTLTRAVPKLTLIRDRYAHVAKRHEAMARGAA